ncbi:MAG: hypothetical protein NTU79_18550 [Planctomycetota bacterium]|nr:hypothetical protein [Planctomycetota bacterium]
MTLISRLHFTGRSMLYYNTRQRLFAILCITPILIPALLFAADTIPFEPTPAKVGSVPQNLLKLVHAPEVQKELELSGDQLASFEEALSKIDGPWWKARIKPESEQRTIIAAQEALLIKLLKSTISPEKLRRLQQIELQSQGTRLFARCGSHPSARGGGELNSTPRPAGMFPVCVTPLASGTLQASWLGLGSEV